MGEKSSNVETVIEEIRIPVDPEKPAFLSYRANRETAISIIVLDNEGRTMYSRQHTLHPGNTELPLNLSGLEAGAYNAWIEVNGKTVIRSFEIHTKNGKGILQAVRSLLGL